MKQNAALGLFRAKTGLILEQWADRMKVFIVENQVAGLSKEALQEMRSNPSSRWALEREALRKALKREVSGLVNRVHTQAYLEELKRK